MLEGAWALRETLFPKDRGQTFPAETTLAHASRTSPPRPRREQRAREHAVGSDLGLRPQAAWTGANCDGFGWRRPGEPRTDSRGDGFRRACAEPPLDGL